MIVENCVLRSTVAHSHHRNRLDYGADLHDGSAGSRVGGGSGVASCGGVNTVVLSASSNTGRGVVTRLLIDVLSTLLGILEVETKTLEVDVTMAPQKESTESWLGEDVENAL